MEGVVGDVELDEHLEHGVDAAFGVFHAVRLVVEVPGGLGLGVRGGLGGGGIGLQRWGATGLPFHRRHTEGISSLAAERVPVAQTEAAPLRRGRGMLGDRVRNNAV